MTETDNPKPPIEVRVTEDFSRWLGRLKDARGKQKIAFRLQRLAFGNPGDVKPVGGGVSEMRVPEGPGYRVYFVQRGAVLVIVLCGGDKSTQSKDIAKARQIASELEQPK